MSDDMSAYVEDELRCEREYLAKHLDNITMCYDDLVAAKDYVKSESIFRIVRKISNVLAEEQLRAVHHDDF